MYDHTGADNLIGYWKFNNSLVAEYIDINVVGYLQAIWIDNASSGLCPTAPFVEDVPWDGEAWTSAVGTGYTSAVSITTDKYLRPDKSISLFNKEPAQVGTQISQADIVLDSNKTYRFNLWIF